MLSACAPNSLSEERAYFQWLNNAENGLVQEKYANGFKVSAKYLPPEYLVYNEIKKSQYTQADIDQLMTKYKANATFMLTIAPDERKEEGRDVVYYEVFDEAAYKERVQELNFHIGEYIELQVGDQSMAPVLHHMENTYGLGKHRNFLLVFGGTESGVTNAEEVDLVFSDEIFKTGISHFVFETEHLEAVPKIGFWNLNQSS